MMGTYSASANASSQMAAAERAAASLSRGEQSPREIEMIIKRMEELASYGRQSTNRADAALDRLLGAEPTLDEMSCEENTRSVEGELRALQSAFAKLERIIAEFDHVSRRLETI